MLDRLALLIPKLGSEFMPQSTTSEFVVELKLPVGTSLERTASTVTNAEGIIHELLGDKIALIYTQAGGDNNSTIAQTTTVKNDNSASMSIFLKPEYADQTEDAINVVDNYLKTIPEIEVSFNRGETALQSSLGTTEAPFVVESKW